MIKKRYLGLSGLFLALVVAMGCSMDPAADNTETADAGAVDRAGVFVNPHTIFIGPRAGHTIPANLDDSTFSMTTDKGFDFIIPAMPAVDGWGYSNAAKLWFYSSNADYGGDGKMDFTSIYCDINGGYPLPHVSADLPQNLPYIYQTYGSQISYGGGDRYWLTNKDIFVVSTVSNVVKLDSLTLKGSADKSNPGDKVTFFFDVFPKNRIKSGNNDFDSTFLKEYYDNNPVATHKVTVVYMGTIQISIRLSNGQTFTNAENGGRSTARYYKDKMTILNVDKISGSMQIIDTVTKAVIYNKPISSTTTEIPLSSLSCYNSLVRDRTYLVIFRRFGYEKSLKKDCDLAEGGIYFIVC